MLAQEVVRQFGDRAQFAVQDFGASPLADRFGIDKYPAILVDDALIARPEDFYAWGGPESGKYVPWSDQEKRKEFQRDLARMIDVRLAGGTLRSEKTSAKVARVLPDLKLTDIHGAPFDRASLRGKPVLVELWATWCPPCLSTLSWMHKLDPNRVQVVAIAVESKREDVDKLAAREHIPGRVVMGTPEILQAFCGVPAVPTLLIADADGRIVRELYGAPPDLHAQIEKALDAITLSR